MSTSAQVRVVSTFLRPYNKQQDTIFNATLSPKNRVVLMLQIVLYFLFWRKLNGEELRKDLKSEDENSISDCF